MIFDKVSVLIYPDPRLFLFQRTGLLAFGPYFYPRTRLQTLLILFFCFYNPKLKFKIINNLFLSPANKRLAQLNKVFTSYKKYNCFLPDQVFLNLNILRKYKAQHKRPNLKKVSLKPTWTAAFRRLQYLKHFFYSPNKLRMRRTVNLRRQFKLWKRRYYHQIKTSFYFGKNRPHHVKRLLMRFHNKSLLKIGLLMSLNPVRLLVRLFPFFDRFFIKTLLASGLVYVNFKQASPKITALRVGDFLHIRWTPLFNRFYQRFFRRQRRYLFEMNRSLRHYFKSKKQFSLNRHKNYLRRFSWYTNLYAKTPAWLEVNYASLSFFIIKMPNKLTFKSMNFNPFLNRLLAF